MKNNLYSGQRYLFHVKKPYNASDVCVRANFVAIRNTTLIVSSHEHEKDTNTQVSIPLDWITEIESLEDIIGENTILYSDVLLIIDNYM